MHVEQLLRAAARDAEAADHLVEDQQRARRVAGSRSSSRNPARGGTNPMFAGSGSAITAATFVVDDRLEALPRSFQGTTIVSAACAAVTPGEAGIPCVASPEPASASRPSTCPW